MIHIVVIQPLGIAADSLELEAQPLRDPATGAVLNGRRNDLPIESQTFETGMNEPCAGPGHESPPSVRFVDPIANFPRPVGLVYGIVAKNADDSLVMQDHGQEPRPAFREGLHLADMGGGLPAVDAVIEPRQPPSQPGPIQLRQIENLLHMTACGLLKRKVLSQVATPSRHESINGRNSLSVKLTPEREDRSFSASGLCNRSKTA